MTERLGKLSGDNFNSDVMAVIKLPSDRPDIIYAAYNSTRNHSNSCSEFNGFKCMCGRFESTYRFLIHNK